MNVSAAQREDVIPMTGLDLTLIVTDHTVVSYLSQFDTDDLQCEKALEALKVGVIAIRSASPTLDTQVVQTKFSEVESKMREQLADFQRKVKDDLCRYFEERDGIVPRSIEGIFGDGGSLTRTFQNFFDPSDGRLCRLMQTQIGPDSAFGRALDPQNKQGVVALVEARVHELVEAKLDEVLEQFSLDEDGSAMFRLKGMLSEFFDRLNQSLGIKAGAAQESQKGHVKGMEFEADLYSAFAEIGRRLGDETENVRGTPGILRKKTGDYVAILGETTGAPGARVALEVKNQRVKLKDAVDEMQEAKQNREAKTGIYVFAKGCEPPEVGDFRRVGEDFYCTVDRDPPSGGKTVGVSGGSVSSGACPDRGDRPQCIRRLIGRPETDGSRGCLDLVHRAALRRDDEGTHGQEQRRSHRKSRRCAQERIGNAADRNAACPAIASGHVIWRKAIADRPTDYGRSNLEESAT
jgi:hypothetical protein